MTPYQKLVRAARERRALLLSSVDVASLALDQAIATRAQQDAEAYCKRTYHRKQRNGKCACSMT